ncbi:hypothetical protein D3C78_1542810 [compost metagenome]
MIPRKAAAKPINNAWGPRLPNPDQRRDQSAPWVKARYRPQASMISNSVKTEAEMTKTRRADSRRPQRLRMAKPTMGMAATRAIPQTGQVTPQSADQRDEM